MIVLWLLIAFPQVILIVAVIFILLHVLPKYGKKESAEEEIDDIDPLTRKLYGEFIGKDGAVDWEEYHKANNEKAMKPGFKEDPEWQRITAELNEHRRKARMESDKEDIENINTDLNEEGQSFWQRVR
jgi:hypothetical protein